MKNKKLIYTEILLLFCIIFASVAGVTTFSADETPEIQTEPESQYYDWIDPFGGWWAVYAVANDYISWSFVCDDVSAEIDVMAMDSYNFWEFYDYYSYDYYPLSVGGWMDVGIFDVPYGDEWYIVFYNDGSVGTGLTYDANFYSVADDIYEDNDYLDTATTIATETWYYNLVALRL